MYVTYTFIDSDPNRICDVAKIMIRLVNYVHISGLIFLNEAVTISHYFGCLE